MVTKKSAQRKHARKRAKERYGIDLTRRDMRAIIRKIDNGKAEFIGRQSLRVTVWKAKYKEEDLTFAYDNKRKTIVTVFPKGAKVDCKYPTKKQRKELKTLFCDHCNKAIPRSSMLYRDTIEPKHKHLSKAFCSKVCKNSYTEKKYGNA
jgi:hypothetical protein